MITELWNTIIRQWSNSGKIVTARVSSQTFQDLKPGEYSPLSGWLQRRTSYTAFHEQDHPVVDCSAGGFIAIDRSVRVHLAGEQIAQNLEASWKAVRKYVRDACELVDSTEESPLLDREEVDMILSHPEIGRPPPPCYPIYFISVRDHESENEELLYIGMTSSKKNRFSGGHAAFTKLHNPKYDGKEKLLYFGTVMLIDTLGEYLPLEAVQPLAEAKKMLLSIESQLIFEFAPELNVKGKKQDNSTAPLDTIHIQNTVSKFLNDRFVFSSSTP